MRLTMLAVIFLLVLTLVNAYVYRKGSQTQTAAPAPSAAVQQPMPLPNSRQSPQHLEWDAFIWREIGAVVVTIVIFGGLHAFAGSSTHER